MLELAENLKIATVSMFKDQEKQKQKTSEWVYGEILAKKL